VNVMALGADFFVFSGHKIYGPTGIGALYGREDVLEEMPPWQGGGSMIENVTFERSTYAPLPARFGGGSGTRRLSARRWASTTTSRTSRCW
jgi:cysteine desulfurase / selenocysteine lyase